MRLPSTAIDQASGMPPSGHSAIVPHRAHVLVVMAAA
jgi:hypothetical protein